MPSVSDSLSRFTQWAAHPLQITHGGTIDSERDKKITAYGTCSRSLPRSWNVRRSKATNKFRLPQNFLSWFFKLFSAHYLFYWFFIHRVRIAYHACRDATYCIPSFGWRRTPNRHSNRALNLPCTLMRSLFWSQTEHKCCTGILSV